MEGSFVVSRKYENKLDIKTRKERGIYYTPYVAIKEPTKLNEKPTIHAKPN